MTYTPLGFREHRKLIMNGKGFLKSAFIVAAAALNVGITNVSAFAAYNGDDPVLKFLSHHQILSTVTGAMTAAGAGLIGGWVIGTFFMGDDDCRTLAGYDELSGDGMLIGMGVGAVAGAVIGYTFSA